MDVTDLVYLDQYGYHYADYPTFLDFVQNVFLGIYGADTYIGADSMDGQWLAILAQMLYDVASLGASIYNAFSPTTAQGVGLSMVVQINGIQREIPSYSTAALLVIGQAGTVITNGVAEDENGVLWSLPPTVTIPSGGAIAVTGTCQTLGAIVAGANTITVMYTPTQGWQSVTNPAAANTGSPVEADGTLRVRQEVSTALPSLTVGDGIEGAVANIPGVDATQYYENYTDDTDDDGLPPHSFCIVCNGGNLTAIAQAIMLKKTPGGHPYAPAGAGYQSIQVFDPKGMPVNIQFYNPPDTADSEVAVEIATTHLQGWSADTITLIQIAVAAFINGLEIGETIYPSALYSSALLVGTPQFGTFQISSLEIKFTSGGSFGTAPLVPAFNAQPNCDADTDVSVT